MCVFFTLLGTFVPVVCILVSEPQQPLSSFAFLNVEFGLRSGSTATTANNFSKSDPLFLRLCPHVTDALQAVIRAVLRL